MERQPRNRSRENVVILTLVLFLGGPDRLFPQPSSASASSPTSSASAS